ncbi:MAG: hypothetical protein JO331_02090, partial [Verrucomicrobia bacterium]|nr:hypothetical protein [Verrucomicrobiota bacterium]
MLQFIRRFPRRAFVALLIGATCQQIVVTAQTKTKPSDQLYIEVSALGSLDYFYDHKLGMQKAGEALGVKT